MREGAMPCPLRCHWSWSGRLRIIGLRPDRSQSRWLAQKPPNDKRHYQSHSQKYLALGWWTKGT